MRISNELQIGKVGEYLVCADLIMKGMIAYPSEQGLPYDVMVDTGDKLIRCQVKTTAHYSKIPQRTKDYNAWIFNVKRHGKGARQIYGKDEVDIFALVELCGRNVAYVKNDDMPGTLMLRVDSLRGSYHDEKGANDFKRVIDLYNAGITNQSEISRKTGVSLGIVNKMCQPGYKPFITTARYFSDLYRERSWFDEL